MKYHLIAITEDQRKSILEALRECGEGLGEDVYFLEKTLEAVEPEAMHELSALDFDPITMKAAELAYLREQRNELQDSVIAAREKGTDLIRRGFKIAGEYDLARAQDIAEHAELLYARIKELENGV